MTPSDRESRLAEALRANLRRRKAAQPPPKAPDEPPPSPPDHPAPMD